MRSFPGTEICSRHSLFVSPPLALYSVLFWLSATVLNHCPPYFPRIALTSELPSVIAGAAGVGAAGGAMVFLAQLAVPATTTASAMQNPARVMLMPSALR